MTIAQTTPQEETLEELEETRVAVLEEMNDIRNQLTARKADLQQRAASSGRVDQYGQPIADPQEFADFSSWRARATAALRHKEIEMADLKLAISAKRTERGVGGRSDAPALKGDDPIQMLAVMLAVVRRLAYRLGGFDQMDEADRIAFDTIQRYLQHKA